MQTTGNYVFPKGKAVNRRKRDFRTAMNLASKRAGLRPIKFHDPRPTFSSLYVVAGGSITSLQKILGHASIITSMRYAHLSPDYLEGEIEKFKIAI